MSTSVIQIWEEKLLDCNLKAAQSLKKANAVFNAPMAGSITRASSPINAAINFMVDVVVQIFFDFALGTPGALILWATKRFQGSYLDVLANHRNKSIAIGLAFWIIVLATVSQIVKV